MESEHSPQLLQIGWEVRVLRQTRPASTKHGDDAWDLVAVIAGRWCDVT